MGLLDAIFPKHGKAEKAVEGYFTALTAYNPVFSTYEGGLYEVMQTRAAIHAFATHCSKLKPEIIGSRNERLARVLQHRPNPYMNTSQFLYRVATIYAATNNAFIAPMYGADMESIIGYYPLLPERVELVNVGGVPYLRYAFSSGQKAAIEYSRAGTMTQMQYKSDFFGESNACTINPALQMIHMQNQGIVEAIKNSAAIRFIGRLGQSLKDSTLREEQKRMREANLSADNTGGIMLVDAKYAEIKQIESRPYVVDAEQMSLINNSVFNYFGTNEAILQNKFDEEQANAFYEGKVEPFAIQLGLALTNMTFTDHAISFGNEIMFSANRLQYASTSAKLQVSQQLFDRGILSTNQVCDIWQLPHIEGGDAHYIRGEYRLADEPLTPDDLPPAPQNGEKIVSDANLEGSNHAEE